MRKFGGIAWALTLGLALSLIAGAVSVVGFGAPAVAPVRTQGTDTSTGGTLEPWPGTDTLTSEISRDLPDDTGNVTIGLAVRWGYLDDPAVMGLEGRWHFNDTRTGGTFVGMWHLLYRRIGGSLEGRFTLPADGNGQFRGTWTLDSTRDGGSLWGSWTRRDATHGAFSGRWDFSGGRPGGALSGDWIQVGDDGGGFRGLAVAAPSIDPVDWDGSLRTSEGAISVLRTVRFERGDEILPRTDRQTVQWNSTTTVNWDGIIFVLRVPRGDPGATVTLRTAPASFEWTARELPGLHIRETVDRAGHAIEVAGFLIGRTTSDYARIQVGMRWGNLSSRDGADSSTGNAFTWDGFAQVTYGGLGLERVLSFERGDGILARDNRVTVAWHSSTTTGWDGLIVVAYVPLAHAEDTYFTLHAGSFTHVFTLRELVGDHTFDAGDGNQVEVHAVRG